MKELQQAQVHRSACFCAKYATGKQHEITALRLADRTVAGDGRTWINAEHDTYKGFVAHISALALAPRDGLPDVFVKKKRAADDESAALGFFYDSPVLRVLGHHGFRHFKVVIDLVYIVKFFDRLD